MKILFSKYHGAGNDFIMINNLNNEYNFNKEIIAKFCNRNLGIGADGLIRIEKSIQADYTMVYYNVDGNIGSMCGNGARSAVIFAGTIGVNFKSKTFEAYDGLHSFEITGIKLVKVSMSEVLEVKNKNEGLFLNTGSPHLVIPVKDLNKLDVFARGKAIRYADEYKKEGVNVNFYELKNDIIYMRTYERGVENETLACGTGTVAVAIANSIENKNLSEKQSYNIKALGGDLNVSFNKTNENIFTNIFLEGPVEKVFEGEIEI